MESETGKGVGDTGGTGEVPEPPAREDRRMIRQAIRNRWPIKREHFEALLDEQTRIALGGEIVIERTIDEAGNVVERKKKPSARERSGAFKALLAAEAQNMEQEKRDLQIPDFHEHNHVAKVEQVVEVVKVTDWYGRPANAPAEAAGDRTKDDLHTGGNAAPGVNPDGPQPL